MNTLADLLQIPPVMFDGAMGTSLIAHGLRRGMPAERFTLDQPDVVADIHRGYVAAGARVLVTNTFNANRMRLAMADLTGEIEACNRQAVAIARDAAGTGVLVAGSIGPTGVLLPPAGVGSEDEARAAFREQASLLADADADILLIETMSDATEASLALAACRDVADLPVIVTLVLAQGRHGFVTPSGDASGDALARLVDEGAFAVGANCALDSATMAPLAGAMRQHISAPLLLKPCAGQPTLTLDGWLYPETPADFAANVGRIAGFGIEMVGGCCGTTPAYIRAAAERIKARADDDPANAS